MASLLDIAMGVLLGIVFTRTVYYNTPPNSVKLMGYRKPYSSRLHWHQMRGDLKRATAGYWY